jgi:hypothetical protein
MDWDWVTKYAVPTMVGLAALTVVPVFFWTNFREAARRPAIIDIATKRITFWNQFLTTVNLATSKDSPERKSQQDKAYQAILRIHSDALFQTESLVRVKKINRPMTWRAFKPERHRLKKWYASCSGGRSQLWQLSCSRQRYWFSLGWVSNIRHASPACAIIPARSFCPHSALLCPGKSLPFSGRKLEAR